MVSTVDNARMSLSNTAYSALNDRQTTIQHSVVKAQTSKDLEFEAGVMNVYATLCLVMMMTRV